MPDSYCLEGCRPAGVSSKESFSKGFHSCSILPWPALQIHAVVCWSSFLCQTVAVMYIMSCKQVQLGNDASYLMPQAHVKYITGQVWPSCTRIRTAHQMGVDVLQKIKRVRKAAGASLPMLSRVVTIAECCSGFQQSCAANTPACHL